MVLQRCLVNWGASAMGICAFFYMWKLYGVMVLHRSMLNWRGSIWHEYMCILQYVKLIGCNGVAGIYAQLEGVCGHSVMSIYALFYMWNWLGVMVCRDLWWIGGGGWGDSGMGICASFSMWKLLGVMVLHRYVLVWRRGGGVSLSWVYVHSSICENDLVKCCCIDLCSIGGGGRVSLPWVFVHAAICETYWV